MRNKTRPHFMFYSQVKFNKFAYKFPTASIQTSLNQNFSHILLRHEIVYPIIFKTMVTFLNISNVQLSVKFIEFYHMHVCFIKSSIR